MGATQSIHRINYQTADEYLQKTIRTQLLCHISYIRQQTSIGTGFVIRAEELHQPISVHYNEQKCVILESPNDEDVFNLLKDLIQESVRRPHITSFCLRPGFDTSTEFQYDIFVIYSDGSL